MRKKAMLICAVIAIVAAGILLAPAVFGSRPFRNLRAEEIKSIELTVRPPDVTVQIVEQDRIREIAAALNRAVIYQKTDEYRDYAGQYVQFALIMNSGEREVAAYNPFLIIDGQGYKTQYEPCEELNRLANAYLSQAINAPEDLKKLLGLSVDRIHELLGEPSGMLSGFWGEIYQLENGTQFTVYYDADGVVNVVKAGDLLFQAE